jgi:hypothetical protein
MSGHSDVAQRLTLKDFEDHGRAGSPKGFGIISDRYHVANDYHVLLLDDNVVQKYCVGLGSNLFAFVDGDIIHYCKYDGAKPCELSSKPQAGLNEVFIHAVSDDHMLAVLHFVHLKAPFPLVAGMSAHKPDIEHLDADPQVLQHFADFCKLIASSKQS